MVQTVQTGSHGSVQVQFSSDSEKMVLVLVLVQQKVPKN